MPVLNDADAIYIGSQAVDIGAFVGRRQVWEPSTPGGDYAVFANPNAYLALSDGDRVARYAGADGAIGGCFSSHTIDEPTEIQALLSSSAGACGFQLYNGTATEAPIDAAFGQWDGQPGLTVMLAPTWVKAFFANQGLPGQITTTLLHDIGYFPSVVERVRIMIRPDGRGWVWSEDISNWYGGGDPAANTSPSFVLGGSSPVRFSAASNNANATVELLLPEDFTGSPISGFRRAVAG